MSTHADFHARENAGVYLLRTETPTGWTADELSAVSTVTPPLTNTEKPKVIVLADSKITDADIKKIRELLPHSHFTAKKLS